MGIDKRHEYSVDTSAVKHLRMHQRPLLSWNLLINSCTVHTYKLWAHHAAAHFSISVVSGMQELRLLRSRNVVGPRSTNFNIKLQGLPLRKFGEKPLSSPFLFVLYRILDINICVGEGIRHEHPRIEPPSSVPCVPPRLIKHTSSVNCSINGHDFTLQLFKTI